MKVKKLLKFIKTNKKGFTLIELALVILVSSIIMSTAIPVWMQKRMQTGVEKTAAEMSNIIAAAKSYYMNAYYNPEDNFPMYARWPENFNDLKSGNYLSQDFPEQNPFLRDYILEANNEYESSYGPYNATFTVRTEVPDEESARYLASIVPGGRIEGNNIVVSEVHIPGSAPSLDNLLHRDAGSTDEHRTMHANIIMSTNENARIVDQNNPYSGSSVTTINGHAGYDLNLDEESHLEDLRVYSEVFIGKSENEDIRIFYQRDSSGFYGGTEDPVNPPDSAGRTAASRYNPPLAVFESNAKRFLFTSGDDDLSTSGFIESARGMFGSSTAEMSWYLNDTSFNKSEVLNNYAVGRDLNSPHILAAKLGRIEDMFGSSGRFSDSNEDYFAYVLPYGTVYVADSAYDTRQTDLLVGAFTNADRNEKLIDIKRGMIYQVAIVEDGAQIPKPKCPVGTQPEIFTAISNFSEGASGIDFPISDFRTTISSVRCGGGDCWEIGIEPSRAIFTGTPLVLGPIDNETGVPQAWGNELWMNEIRLDTENLDLILNLVQLTSMGQSLDPNMEAGHGTYNVLVITACR